MPLSLDLVDLVVDAINAAILKYEFRGGLRADSRDLAERAVMVLFAALPDLSLTDDGFVKVVDRDDPGLKPFASFLKSGQPRCGLLRGRQKGFAFEDNASGINSAALIPLGEDTELGFIVIGSQDPDYFNPGKGMDFLSRLGELVTVALTGGAIVEATSGPNAAGS